MDKRLILAIVLAIAIMTGYQFIVSRLYPPAVEQPQEFSSPQEFSPVIKQISRPAPELLAPTTAQGETKDLVVDTGLFRAIFTTRGARIKSYRLKKYQARDVKLIDLEKEIDREKNKEKKRELEAYLGEVVEKNAILTSLGEA